MSIMGLNSKWYHLMLEVANKAAKIPGVKRLLKPLYYPIKKRVEKSQRKKLMQNGIRILQLFDRCMQENSIKYTITFGTLLGAMREKGFIGHDLDIDVTVWNDQYSEQIASALKSAGFELVHAFRVEDGSIGREETYMCEGVAIDIFYIHDDGGKYPYYCVFAPIDGCPTFNQSMRTHGRIKARRMDIPMIKERERVPFESIELYAPTNAHEILSFIYGENYMIPDPTWEMDPKRFNWMDKAAYYYEA